MKRKIKNIKKGFVSLALVTSTILTGLSLTQKTYASEMPTESQNTKVENNTYNNTDYIKTIFQAYVINYRLANNPNSPQFSEYYNVVNEIFNSVKNCEKNKLAPYNDSDILKAANSYAKEYFYTLNAGYLVNIPDNIGNNIYNAIPVIAASYKEPTAEELEEVTRYDGILKTLIDFYKFVYPTLIPTISENNNLISR